MTNSGIADYELNDTSQYKVSRTAASFLFFLVILFIQVPISTGIKCSPTDIKLRNTRTGRIEKCILCPECIPSQQYSIPCGSTVDKMTVGQCGDCPEDTYSEHFDKRPCQPCTKCSNKVIKRNCTKDHNAECGGCLPGYKYDPTSFACIKISMEKTTTSSPTTVTTTSATTTTSTATTATSTATTPNKSTTKTANVTSVFKQEKISELPPTHKILNYTNNTSQFKNQTVTMTDLQATKGFPKWAIALITLSGILFVTINAAIGFFLLFIKKRKETSRRSDGEAGLELLETTRTNEEQCLKDFMSNNLDQTESLCKVLFKKRHGTWDFERVGKKWSDYINDTDLSYIVQLASHVPNSTPVRMVLQKLCTEVRPPLTVRTLADSLKKINKKAYRILQPHFKKPTVCTTDE